MKTLTNFPYSKVLVLGLAKSGEAAAQLLYDSGIDFRINDQLPLKMKRQSDSLNWVVT